jgi:membrane protease YdiL (CAAX protease family)
MKNSKPLVVYIALAYLVSWLTFILLALNHQKIIHLFPDDIAHSRVQDLWHSFGGLGPVLAAVITLKLLYSRGQRQRFLNGYSIKKIKPLGWILAFSPLLIFIFSLLIRRIITNEWFDIGTYFESNQLDQPANLLGWILPILFYGFGEEGGWRGFALPALQSRFSALNATVLLFVIWACWHIPSFFYRYDLQGVAYVAFLLGLFSGTVWLTFLFNYTKGSILAVSLWHLTFNFVSMIGKDEIVLSTMMSIMVMLMATFVLMKYKLQNLSPYRKITLEMGQRRMVQINSGLSTTTHPILASFPKNLQENDTK